MPQQGAPAGYGYPESPPAYQGGYSGPPPNYYPPAAPPPKGKAGLILGIAGAALALVAIVAGIFLVTKRGGAAATATPARTVTASATVTTVATGSASATQGGIGNLPATLSAAATATAAVRPSNATPAATIGATPSAAATRAIPTPTRTTSAASSTTVASRPAGSVISIASVSAGASASTSTTARAGTAGATPAVALAETWTDPDGHLTLRYPTGWTVTQQQNSQSNLVEIDSPDGASFFVDLFPAAGTPAEEIQSVRDSGARSTQLTYAFSPITDTRIGGEAGKTISYTVRRKDQPTSVGTDGTVWVVNHAGMEYDFQVIATGRHRIEIDAILATVVFT